nr:MAG TPA: hypothetical protein [Caudoviricetes sp.]
MWIISYYGNHTVYYLFWNRRHQQFLICIPMNILRDLIYYPFFLLISNCTEFSISCSITFLWISIVS